MTTINLNPKTYAELQRLMAIRLEKQFKGSNKGEIISHIIKNKYGITFDTMISIMMKEYKSRHKN